MWLNASSHAYTKSPFHNSTLPHEMINQRRILLIATISVVVIAGIITTILLVTNKDDKDSSTGSGSSSNSSPSKDSGGASAGTKFGEILIPRGNIVRASATGQCRQGDNCKLPECYCSSTSIPGGLPREQTPQFITLTYDDALYESMWTNLARELVMNPQGLDATGCGVRTTWYLTSVGTDFSLIEQVIARGHEVASHTTTHLNPTSFSVDQWTAEVASMRNYTDLLVNGLSRNHILGNRAPWLQYSDNMFTALYQDGFLYDSSVIERHDSGVSNANLQMKTGNWQWPYTLDFGLKNRCDYSPQQCPSMAYPGFWEVPMTVNVDHSGSGFASEMDPPLDGEALQTLFRDNFLSRYNGNRGPMGIFLHGTWLTTSRVAELQKFFAWAAENEGVFFVTPLQIIEWMRNPRPIGETINLEFMKCPTPPARSNVEDKCDGWDNDGNAQIDENVLNTCTFIEGTLRTCAERCPIKYPNTGGTLDETSSRQSSWRGDVTTATNGGCVDVTIRNTDQKEIARSFTVSIPSRQSLTIGSNWGGRASFTNGMLELTSESGLNLSPGASIAMGLCTTGSVDLASALITANSQVTLSS